MLILIVSTCDDLTVAEFVQYIFMNILYEKFIQIAMCKGWNCAVANHFDDSEKTVNELIRWDKKMETLKSALNTNFENTILRNRERYWYEACNYLWNF